ncbi:hypothetical protein [Streptomyces bungoensis]|nr:hypothetical protein [Streptomyces bungoensis]
MTYDDARRVDISIAITLHGSAAYGWTPVEVVTGPLAVVDAEATGGKRAGHPQDDRNR